VGAFHCYAPSPETGAKLECRVLRKHEDEKVIHSDIEVLDGSGKVYYRLENWETRRFKQPPRFLHLRVSPKEAYVSEPWDTPIAAIEDQAGLACSKLADLTPELLESSHGIWLKTLAYLVLSRRERKIWEGMHGAVLKRCREWLLGRCAAKDAVRTLLKRQLGLELCAADVEIVQDASGRPVVEGAWKSRAGVEPAISISHSHGVAVALAAIEPGWLLGIDIEVLGLSPSPYETAAFSEEERGWIDRAGQELREEWSLRLWCAKEAAAKALGKDLSSVVNGIRVAGAEHDAGLVRLISDNGAILAHTQREGDLISSSVVYPSGARR
jgi:phosphopantetheinyl transferase